MFDYEKVCPLPFESEYDGMEFWGTGYPTCRHLQTIPDGIYAYQMDPTDGLMGLYRG